MKWLPFLKLRGDSGTRFSHVTRPFAPRENSLSDGKTNPATALD